VTNFFRDRGAFDYLQTEVLPSLLENFPNQETFRVWVPGCSTGEEVYSLAMILREVLDNCSKYINLQIFGTDIDQVAIDYARNGIYPASIADIGQQRSNKDFALCMPYLVDVLFPFSDFIRVVLDNLNTHTPAALCWGETGASLSDSQPVIILLVEY